MAESEVGPQEPEMTPERVKKSAELNAAKDKLTQAVLEYRGLLKDTTLPRNQSQDQKKYRNRVLHDLNSYAGDLEELNVGEGIFSLAFLALHSIVLMNDEINELKFNNFMLYKKVKALQAAQGQTEKAE